MKEICQGEDGEQEASSDWFNHNLCEDGFLNNFGRKSFVVFFFPVS